MSNIETGAFFEGLGVVAPDGIARYSLKLNRWRTRFTLLFSSGFAFIGSEGRQDSPESALERTGLCDSPDGIWPQHLYPRYDRIIPRQHPRAAPKQSIPSLRTSHKSSTQHPEDRHSNVPVAVPGPSPLLEPTTTTNQLS